MIEKNKFEYYSSLFKMSYLQLVDELIQKYGSVKDDYFEKGAYSRFLNGDVERIFKGSYSRTSDGLYCHHVFENKFHNLSDLNTIKRKNYPFEFQKKENLVYCNLIEHVILHTLISKETNKKFGFRELESYLINTVIFWYVLEIKPKKRDVKYFSTSFLTVNQANVLITKIYNEVNFTQKKDIKEIENILKRKHFSELINLSIIKESIRTNKNIYENLSDSDFILVYDCEDYSDEVKSILDKYIPHSFVSENLQKHDQLPVAQIISEENKIRATIDSRKLKKIIEKIANEKIIIIEREMLRNQVE